MRSTTFYNELKSFCQHVYKTPTQDLAGWVYQEQATSKDGLFVAIYTKGSDTAFVIRGTESIPDVISDIGMYLRKYTSQFNSAYIYYLKVKAKYENIVFTGHSLGGSIAQYLGNQVGNMTVTFEAYGVGQLYKTHYTNNIINYGNLYDPVFLLSLSNQLGACYITDVGNPKISLKWHFLESSGDISTAVPLKDDALNMRLRKFLAILAKDLSKITLQTTLQVLSYFVDSLFNRVDKRIEIH